MASTLRDKMVPVVGSLRQLPDDFGFRPYTLTIKVRTWPSQLDVGSPTVESYEITPRPKIRRGAQYKGAHETDETVGRFQEGVYTVDKITPRFITPTVGGYFPRATMGTPQAPTVTPHGAAGATTWRYKVIAFNADIACSKVSAAGFSLGAASLDGTNFNRLVTAAVSGATVYWWYRTAGGPTQGLIGTSTTPTFDDTGLVGDGTAALPPVLMPEPLELQRVVYVVNGRDGVFECNLHGDVFHGSLGYQLTLVPGYARSRAG